MLLHCTAIILADVRAPSSEASYGIERSGKSRVGGFVDYYEEGACKLYLYFFSLRPRLLTIRSQHLFAPYYTRFLVRSDDLTQVKKDKIRLLLNVLNTDNYAAIMREFIVSLL